MFWGNQTGRIFLASEWEWFSLGRTWSMSLSWVPVSLHAVCEQHPPCKLQILLILEKYRRIEATLVIDENKCSGSILEKLNWEEAPFSGLPNKLLSPCGPLVQNPTLGFPKMQITKFLMECISLQLSLNEANYKFIYKNQNSVEF